MKKELYPMKGIVTTVISPFAGEEKKLDLVLCGHVHKPSLKVDSSGRGECIAGSVSRNGSMMEIEYDSTSRQFAFRTVEL